MTVTTGKLSTGRRILTPLLSKLWAWYSHVPLLGWLFAALIAVTLEGLLGTSLARLLGMSKPPVLFGFHYCT